ncbi:Variable major protein (plasmid) [Borrelia coriaceae ATCC 43381]|uniref:Variable major protein n=1 Tax=Borrelia coriaceae ATCC 43381 TaxID=1408429 RepID=W5SXC0_9SPIR|nr:Variable major protein [Borrelia coriaceae ATCC 43381]
MINKIKTAKIPSSSVANTNASAANNDIGMLTTKLPGSGGDTHNGSKSNADLVAAVALKAITKKGKFY